jgi:hypothetical protein
MSRVPADIRNELIRGLLGESKESESVVGELPTVNEAPPSLVCPHCGKQITIHNESKKSTSIFNKDLLEECLSKQEARQEEEDDSRRKLVETVNKNVNISLIHKLLK